ncbi:MAG: ATP-binding protein, partial [Chloroflexi bacterium]|nr:ATP-binding protein [Chloroflexota bacterium]
QPTSFSNTADLLDTIRSTYDSHTYDKTFRAICEVPLLLLTDLGYENSTPWAQEKMYQLFNYRSLHQLAMVVTTTIEMARLDSLPPQRRGGRIIRHILRNPDCKILSL